MPSESDLRDLLQGADPEGRAAIDLDAVLTRARRRRRPKVVAAQALGSIAVVGVLGTAIFVAQPPAQQTAMIAQDTAEGQEFATAPQAGDEDSAPKWIPDSCGAPVIDRGATDGLVVEMTPLTTDAGVPVETTVTLVNTGSAPVVGGSTGQAALTLSRDGIVVWHTLVMTQPYVDVDLAPGESADFSAGFVPVVCEDDEQLLGAGGEMAEAPAGTYELRAVIEVWGADGTTLVATGGPVTVEIR